MTPRLGRWRAWLAATMSVGLAGTGTLTLGRAAAGSSLAPAASAATGKTAPPPGSIAGARPPASAQDPRPALLQPAWRSRLETRWQQRLAAVTELSLAYHDAAEAPAAADAARRQTRSRQLHELLHKAVAARRALCDTEEALARLSAGSYGRCEQCSATISPALLALEPETRYCEGCFHAASANAHEEDR